MPASEIFLTIKTDTKEEETEIISQLLDRLQYPLTFLTLSECPDFEIELSGKLIGIEITKYYSDFTGKGSKTQQKISEWKKTAELLKNKLYNANSEFDYLYGSIHFLGDKVNYNELLKDSYFNELINLLNSEDLNRNEQKSIQIAKENFPLLSTYIDSISVCSTYPENIHLWWDSSLQSGLMHPNEFALTELIEKKEKSSKKYKQEYYQKWLVIYAGGIGLSDLITESSMDIFKNRPSSSIKSEEVQSNDPTIRKSSYFTHVILWDKFSENVFLLLPYYKKVFDYSEGKIWISHLPIKMPLK